MLKNAKNALKKSAPAFPAAADPSAGHSSKNRNGAYTITI
jgi:hypothetical protein